jgi:hypothetical protein
MSRDCQRIVTLLAGAGAGLSVGIFSTKVEHSRVLYTFAFLANVWRIHLAAKGFQAKRLVSGQSV